MRDGQTREDRATQPMEAGWLSFAISRNIHILEFGLIYNKEHLKRWNQDSFGMDNK